MQDYTVKRDSLSKIIDLEHKHDAQTNVITVMQRRELKYILNKEQIEYLKLALNGHMQVDQYGKTSIASIYYDTPDYRLIRTSIQKPEFKEKIRLRSYGLAKPSSTVFLELKRKANKVVYKRRISLKEDEVSLLLKGNKLDQSNQIEREISYFTNFYPNLSPAFLIIYDRLAYFEKGTDLRLTIDENPRYRTQDLNLHTSLDGESLLEEGGGILEIKVQQAIPLWLVDILSKGKIYKASFSKVGHAYLKELSKNQRSN